MLAASQCTIRRFSSATSFKVLVAGAGTAGLSVASKLSRLLPSGSVGIVEPRDDHYYQPLFTFVGGGIKKLSESRSDTKSLIPKGVNWIQDSVTEFAPKSNSVTLKSGQKVC